MSVHTVNVVVSNMEYETFNKSKKEKILKRDNYRCHLCNATTNLHVHHILPRCLGGGHDDENLVTLCAKCHGIVEHGSDAEIIEKCVKRAIKVELARQEKNRMNVEC